MSDNVQKRKSLRYGLNVQVEVTDTVSGVQLSGQTSDVAMHGCGITALSQFPQGTRVRVKLVREEAEVVALGRVVYSRPDLGMGIAYTTIEPQYESILAEWIGELANYRNPPPGRPMLERM